MSIGARRMLVGTENGSAKLTESRVVAMRVAYTAGVSQVKLSKKYRVSQSVVSSVVRGATWTHAGGPRAKPKEWATFPKDNSAAVATVCKLSSAQVLAIREARLAGRSGLSLAKEYGVSPGTMSAILHGDSYKHVGGPVLTR